MSTPRCADGARWRPGHIFGVIAVILAAMSMISLAGCGAGGLVYLATPQGAIVGRGGYWNYSPSVIQTGDVLQFWWCGAGMNPENTTQISDTILYETVNTVTHATSIPVIVLAESQGTWDAEFTCNPRVIRGTFVNPLGDGATYSYEMFYVGTLNNFGYSNSIGAAFSNDGIHWTKYPEPLILATSVANYGVGQPAAYNTDGRSSITLFYEDYTPTCHHVKATSTDGIHFAVQGTITTNGLDPTNPDPPWGDIGYDPTTRSWYAAFDLPTRASTTTGGFVERGPYGFQLYRIPDSSLLTGVTPWQMLQTVDTNLTGYEANFLPSLLHDQYGNINIGTYPTLELFVSTSFPKPAWDASPKSAGTSGDVYQWAIAGSTYQPSQTLMTLKRYINAQTYEVSTGWVDPVRFFSDGTLGHLFSVPQQGATQPFYGCKEGSTAYFVSLDPACNGQRILGVNGYGYAKKPAGIETVALYNCTSTQYGKYLSQDAACKGNGAGSLFAYALP